MTPPALRIVLSVLGITAAVAVAVLAASGHPRLAAMFAVIDGGLLAYVLYRIHEVEAESKAVARRR